MNQRIRELAEQTIGTNPKYAVAMIMASPELEKFAQLIIQECCDVVRYIDAVDIKRHFGVKS